MADSPTSAMTTVVSWLTMPGMDSGRSTRVTICSGVAPMESAASMRPCGTSRSEVSTCRPMNGTEAMTSGTIAAVVPIAEPTMRRVSGMIATIRMMNGMERIALTTAPIERFTAGASRISPRAVTCRSTPSGMPSALEMTILTATI